jgi:hypothetical protein
MLYLFYNTQLMIRIIDKTTWQTIQDYIPPDCIFSHGVIPDFTIGTKLYGVRNGQNLRTFNILTTTVQTYMSFPLIVKSIIDVGGSNQKLIIIANNG